MDAEEEFVNLIGPVSLPEAVKSTLEVINLMSITSDSPASTLPIFQLALWVEYYPRVKPKTIQDPQVLKCLTVDFFGI